MNPIYTYIYDQEEPFRSLLIAADALFQNNFGLHPNMRYRIPFYDQHTWICYLNIIKKKGIELAFIHGNELNDEHQLLQAKGRKQIRGVLIAQTKQLYTEELQLLIQEAIVLDSWKHERKS